MKLLFAILPLVSLQNISVLPDSNSLPKGAAMSTNALPVVDESAAPAERPVITHMAARKADKVIVYKKTPQGDLALHLYLPPGWKESDTRPAIIFFFGGGWTGGGPIQFFAKSEYLSSRGIVAISAEYRVKNTHGVTPDICVEDARSAMRWLKSHAGGLGIDPKRIIASGGSAGGHLAAATAVCPGPDDAGDDLEVSPRPAALVLFNPVTDMRIEMISSRMPGKTDEEKMAVAVKISPVAHVTSNTPPSILLYGTADEFLKMGNAFAQTCAVHGVRSEVWTAAGQPHAFFNKPPWHEATMIKADEFLTSLGFLKGAPTMQPASTNAVMVKWVRP